MTSPSQESSPWPETFKEASTAFQKTFQEMGALQFSIFNDMLEAQKDLKNLWPHTAPEIFQKLNQTPHSLTIFAPAIIQETLDKVREKLDEKLEKDPSELHAIGLSHFKKQQTLILKTLESLLGRLSEPVIETPKNDRRFQSPLWEQNAYFSHLKQHYLLFSEFTQQFISALGNFDPKTQAKLDFYIRHLLDLLSPSNFIASNPEVLRETITTQGKNLQKGYENFLEDLEHGYIRMTDMKGFKVGETLATTQGSVVFRNDILELIRYTPRTEKVHEYPLLIIPAWINKFYVFDLRPENSFVKWCLDQGLQVYIVSWVNPEKGHAKKSFGEYVLDGLYTAVRAVLKESKTQKLNAFGFCAGGILLNCLMAYLEAHKITSPFQSASTLASPIDASKGGNLLAYLCDKQIKILEESIEDLGFIPGPALIHSFNLLKPKDLMWSFYVNHYLLGKDPKPFDMLYWNCDAMNLPGRMHLKYLKSVFLDNKLMQKGTMRVAGTPIDLSLIRTPSFIFGAINDHIVQWESVYPLVNMIQSQDKMFLLGGSGHIGGVINPPTSSKYQFWKNESLAPTAKEWFQNAKEVKGSWWHDWLSWMTPYLGKTQISPSPITKGLDKAPGSYVFKKAYVLGSSQKKNL